MPLQLSLRPRETSGRLLLSTAYHPIASKRKLVEDIRRPLGSLHDALLYEALSHRRSLSTNHQSQPETAESRVEMLAEPALGSDILFPFICPLVDQNSAGSILVPKNAWALVADSGLAQSIVHQVYIHH